MTVDPSAHRALVVEDDPEIARLVALHLADIRCAADVEADGRLALARFDRGAYDLVVLDLNLPGMDGLALCRELRSRPGYVPILMLTAKSSELDRVLGLEMGADDYLTKPFSVRELVARAKALFRRTEAMAIPDGDEGEAVIEHGELRIDPARRSAEVRGSEVTLTAKEFDLLLHFARNPGRVYSRARLLDTVWGYKHEGYEHTVNSHINRLRAKIEEDPSSPRLITTVWGVGYRMAEG